MVCLEKLIFSETFGLSPSDKSVLLDGDSYILRKLQFRSGSTEIPKNAEGELDQLYQFFKKYPNHSILIGGYTDSSGRAGQNQKISRLIQKWQHSPIGLVQQKQWQCNRLAHCIMSIPAGCVSSWRVV